jgi:hypothetical protein
MNEKAPSRHKQPNKTIDQQQLQNTDLETSVNAPIGGRSDQGRTRAEAKGSDEVGGRCSMA